MSYEHLNIYVVNGAPGAGKTTFERYVRELMPERYCFIISSIEYVKYVAEYCGWEQSKTPEDRKFLSDLKKVLTEWKDLPFQHVKKHLDSIEAASHFHEFSIKGISIFVDVREPAEIQRYCDEFQAKSIIIRNTEAEQQYTSNSSDANVLDYAYDIIIDNNGSLNDLRSAAEQFVIDQNLAQIIKTR